MKTNPEKIKREQHEKKYFKLFDFFTNCLYLIETFNYDEKNFSGLKEMSVIKNLIYNIKQNVLGQTVVI